MDLRSAATVLLFTAVLQSAAEASELRGRVLDENDKPIPDARVDLVAVASKQSPGLVLPSCDLDDRKSVRAKEQGEFAIGNLRDDWKFRIIASVPGRQAVTTELLDPEVDSPVLRLPAFPADTPGDRVLEGLIVSPKGTPIAGALIAAEGAKTAQRRWLGPVNAQPCVSDDAGRFRMLLAEAYEAVDLEVTPDGSAATSAMLRPPGKESCTITLSRGTQVTGRLVLKGEPVADVPVAVVQTDRGASNYFPKAVLTTTDQNGAFGFRTLPGAVQYAVFSPVGMAASSATIDGGSRPVLTTKLFKARGDGESRDLGTLELTRGHLLAGRVEMADKSPLPEGLKLILGRAPAWDAVETTIRENGRFEFPHLPTGTYTLRVVAKNVCIDVSRLKYQAIDLDVIGIRLKEDENNLVLPLRSDRGIAAASDESAGAIPWRANCPDVLAPAARETVRLAGQVMRNGQPQRGVSVKLLRGKAVFRAETPFTVVAEAITDEQGGYVVGGLRPGDCYRVELLLTGMAAPDWPYQSPYIRGVPADANGVIDVPEARLVSTDQSLAGTVVNLHGKPVAGATVGATLDRVI
jgi:hypothetical protein